MEAPERDGEATPKIRLLLPVPLDPEHELSQTVQVPGLPDWFCRSAYFVAVEGGVGKGPPLDCTVTVTMLEAHRVLPAESRTETKNWWLPADNVEVLKESCGLELCPICTQLSRQNTTVA